MKLEVDRGGKREKGVRKRKESVKCIELNAFCSHRVMCEESF